MNKSQLRQLIREEVRSILGNEINEGFGVSKAGPKEVKAAKDVFEALKKAGIDPTLKLPDVTKQGRGKFPVSIDVGENEVEVQAATLGLDDQEKNQRLNKIVQAIKSVGLDIAKREDNVGVYKLSVFTVNTK